MIETIGVIGGGQLGRMFALDAKRMGFSVIALDPQPHSPCGQVADEQIVAAYDDMAAVDELGARADVVTYEFENIAIASVKRLESSGRHVSPSSSVLGITQDRLLEKQFVRSCGIATTDFVPVSSPADVANVPRAVGFPAIVKTVRGGYDGKGQQVVADLESLERAMIENNGASMIAERLVEFRSELSVIAARGASGDVVTYPATENLHEGGILRRTIAPANIAPEIGTRAQEIAATMGRKLEIVGTYCVEFFLTGENELLVNEIAPRPHNSGHYTIDVTPCSQYEQHIRSICGLPLSTPRLLANALMFNILGDGKGDTLGGIAELLADPSIVLHVYGKRHAIARRKMGHFTMVVDGPCDEATIARAEAALKQLYWC